jgi:hypothetical protein
LAPVKCDVRLYQQFGSSVTGIGIQRDAEAGADFNSVASQIERLRERVDNTLGKAGHRILLAPIRESSKESQAFWRLV